MQTRNPIFKRKSSPTMEGAGVALHRAIGHGDVPMFDPFLLLDDFRSTHPADYRKGFPWHPHRGIETITYLIQGAVEHSDSLGNSGVINSGDVQWMTAGSGIIHQEMPQVKPDVIILGFQLWANLPASHKMMKPRYRDIKSNTIPEMLTTNGCKVRVICGTFNNTTGPVTDIVTDPEFFDIEIPPQTEFRHTVKKGYTVFCYVIDGGGYFSDKTADALTMDKSFAENRTLVLLGEGDQFVVHTRDENIRFLFLSGKPIGETVAWYGPIVMNTQSEIEIAFEEYDRGTFIKK